MPPPCAQIPEDLNHCMCSELPHHSKTVAGGTSHPQFPEEPVQTMEMQEPVALAVLGPGANTGQELELANLRSKGVFLPLSMC